MKHYDTNIRDSLWPHHTENDCLEIKIVFGKDHHHLEIKEGTLSRNFISKRKNELIDYGIEILKEYKKFKRKSNE